MIRFRKVLSDRSSVVHRATRNGRTIGYVVATVIDSHFHPTGVDLATLATPEIEIIVRRCRQAEREIGYNLRTRC